jgi:hypothetical protein
LILIDALRNLHIRMTSGFNKKNVLHQGHTQEFHWGGGLHHEFVSWGYTINVSGGYTLNLFRGVTPRIFLGGLHHKFVSGGYTMNVSGVTP